MTNNNHQNNFSCAFAEILVSVLYDEATAAEKREFSIHLENCAACRAESISFGMVRNSVADWRETDFERLATPQIMLPPQHATKIARQTGNLSWSAKLRDLFSPSSNNFLQGARAFAAVAVGVVLLGVFGYSVLSFYPIREVADVPGTEPAKNVWSSPTPPPTPSPSVTNPPPPSGDQQIVKSSQSNDSAPIKSVPKSSKGATAEVGAVPSHLPERRRKNQKAPIGTLPKSVSATPAAIEPLDDLEDGSLRLTDLLDDVTPSR